MKDKYNDASTGPDFYFEKALQYPDFSSRPLSFSTQGSNYNFVLLPSSLKIKYNEGQASSTTRVMYHSWSPARKDRPYSPIHSPGSDATGKTSMCTQDDYETEDDLISHCGSLTYSVESWAVDPYSQEDIDDGYNAEDEDTAYTSGDVRRPHYNIDQGDDECFGVDLCFQPLDWASSFVKSIFRTLEGVPGDHRERRLASQQRLIERCDAFGPA